MRCQVFLNLSSVRPRQQNTGTGTLQNLEKEQSQSIRPVGFAAVYLPDLDSCNLEDRVR